MNSFNQTATALTELRNRYFAEQISPEQYRVARNKILEQLSQQVNGSVNTGQSNPLLAAKNEDWQDQNPFSG